MLTKFVFLAVLAVVSSEHDDALLVKAHNHFAVKLLKQLAAENPSTNVFFSPTSIAAAFGMAYAGARGTSEAELAAALGHTEVGLTDRPMVLAAYRHLQDLTASPNITLDVVNMVLAQSNFQIADNFRQHLHNVFDAEFRSVDFANEGPRVASEVNAWVREKTRGKINDILPEGQPLDTILFILNAVSFKGSWITPFDPTKTEDRPFLNLGTTEVSKPAMHTYSPFRYASLDTIEARALELPYSGGRFSMVILIPNSTRGVATLRDSLSLAVLEDVDRKLRYRRVGLWLPKFEMNLRYGLVPAMKALGLNVVFGSGANFTGISENAELSISDVVHKAALEVNEEGTVATAVTGLSIVPASALIDSEPPVKIIVYHPFLYYIRDTTNNRVLFIGEVNSL